MPLRACGAKRCRRVVERVSNRENTQGERRDVWSAALPGGELVQPRGDRVGELVPGVEHTCGLGVWRHGGQAVGRELHHERFAQRVQRCEGNSRASGALALHAHACKITGRIERAGFEMAVLARPPTPRVDPSSIPVPARVSRRRSIREQKKGQVSHGVPGSWVTVDQPMDCARSRRENRSMGGAAEQDDLLAQTIEDASGAEEWSQEDRRRARAWALRLPGAERQEVVDLACRSWQRQFLHAYHDPDLAGVGRDPLAFREQFAQVYLEVVRDMRDRLARLGCADESEEQLLRLLTAACSQLAAMTSGDSAGVAPPSGKPDPKDDVTFMLELLEAEAVEECLTVEETAYWLATSDRTLREWRKTNGFPSPMKKSGRDMYSVVAIARWCRQGKDGKRVLAPLEQLPERVKAKLRAAREHQEERDRRQTEEDLGRRHADDGGADE